MVERRCEVPMVRVRFSGEAQRYPASLFICLLRRVHYYQGVIMRILKRVNTGTTYVARRDGEVRVVYTDKIFQKFILNKGDKLILYGNYPVYQYPKE